MQKRDEINMTSELSQALDTQILDANKRMIEAFAQGSDRLLAAANARRECGLLLIERKRLTSHGEWEKLFSNRSGKSESVFTFTYETARNYIAMAKHHPEEFTDFAEVMQFQAKMGRDAGLLEAPSPRQQCAHEMTFGLAIIQLSSKFASAYKKYDAEEWLSTISGESKERFLDQIKPVKERLDRIYARLQEA